MKKLQSEIRTLGERCFTTFQVMAKEIKKNFSIHGKEFVMTYSLSGRIARFDVSIANSYCVEEVKTKNSALMKTKLIALALTCMSFTIAYGNNPVQIQKTSNPAIFKLTYAGNDSDPVVIKVTDEKGNVLVKRCVKTARSFSLPLNFASREFGKYLVKISDGSQTQVQEISYGNNSTISSPLQKPNSLISHTTALKEGKYLVSVAKGQVSTARVTVLDADNDIVFTTTRDAVNGAAFVLNTKNVQRPMSIQITDASYK